MQREHFQTLAEELSNTSLIKDNSVQTGPSSCGLESVNPFNEQNQSTQAAG